MLKKINDNIINDKRVRIIAGHYGSGKTTFALNYALQLSELDNKNISVSDLDVVNPYFRLREHRSLFDTKNIRLLGSLIKETASDLPAVSSDILTSIYDKTVNAIIDLGGDEAGSRAFATFKEHIDKNETDLFIVVNTNREATQNIDDIIFYMESIERTIEVKATAIISNSHLMNYTTASDIINGFNISEQVAKIKNIDTRYVLIDQPMTKYIDEILNHIDKEKIFILDYSVREDYLR